MAVRHVVQCGECGHPYAARIIDGEVILPTNDGNCRCGNDTFVLAPGSSSTSGEPVS